MRSAPLNPKASPCGHRSDARNSLSNQLGHPIGWSPVFPVLFFCPGNKTGVPGGRQLIAKSLWALTRQPAARRRQDMRPPLPPLCHSNFVRPQVSLGWVANCFGHAGRSSVGLWARPAMVRLRRRTRRPRCRLPMIIRALDAVSADAGQCCHALLPTRVIAGHGTAPRVVAPATNCAPWIGIGRLRNADLRFAQQSDSSYKQHDDWHPHHSLSPLSSDLFASHIIAFAEAAEVNTGDRSARFHAIGFSWTWSSASARDAEQGAPLQASRKQENIHRSSDFTWGRCA